MKIVYISPGNIPSRWAHTFQIMKMAEALSEHVDRLTLLTQRSLLPSPMDAIDLREWYGVGQGFRITRLPLRLRLPQASFECDHSTSFSRAAAYYARLLSPDLVFTRSPDAGARCVRLGLPTLIEDHTPADHCLQRWILPIAKHPKFLGLITVTNYLAEIYLRAGFPAEKLLVWPDAVDLERFSDLPDRDLTRRSLGLPVDQKIALYTGHFYEAKGVPSLVDAAAQAPGVDFRLLGGWPQDIEAMRLRGANADNLHFEGFLPNAYLPSWLAAADVLVLPNSALSEHAHATSPLKLFEYMASRRPIVATKIPAVESVLEHGVNAYLVAPDCPQALAEGIRTLAENPALGESLARRAFENVQAYSWKQRARDVLDRFATWE